MPSDSIAPPRSMATPEALAGLDVSEADVEQFRRRLEKPPLFVVIPPRMRDAYRRYRFRDLARYLRIGAPLLAALIIGLSLMQTEFFDDALEPFDRYLWTAGTVVVCALLVSVAAAVQHPRIRRSYELVASVVGSVVLLKLAVMPQFLTHPVAVRTESYFCMLTVFIIAVALRFRLVIAAATVLGSGLLALFVIVAFVPAPDFRVLTYSYGASAAVGLFMAWHLDEKEKGAFLQAVLIQHDARAREALHERVLMLSRHDVLSGLANRRELERRLGLEWERLRRDQNPLALVFADIDFFKAYNDVYGHAAGDRCIAQIAKTLSASLLRPADFAARYGGEEFVIVLPDTDEAGALDVARRVLEAVDALEIAHSGSPEHGHITVSLGVAAVVPDAEGSTESLLDIADRALYVAKRSGRRQVRAASES